MRKPKYEIGDYVRIKNIHIDDDYPSGVIDDMLDFANKLARITDTRDEIYHIDLDNGKWDWDEDMFEYRLGNYEDNNIENRRCKYIIGYKTNKDGVKIKRFNGFIENFAPCNKSVFVDENGKTLVLTWELIEYIVPIDEWQIKKTDK